MINLQNLKNYDKNAIGLQNHDCYAIAPKHNLFGSTIVRLDLFSFKLAWYKITKILPDHVVLAHMPERWPWHHTEKILVPR